MNSRLEWTATLGSSHAVGYDATHKSHAVFSIRSFRKHVIVSMSGLTLVKGYLFLPTFSNCAVTGSSRKNSAKSNVHQVKRADSSLMRRAPRNKADTSFSCSLCCQHLAWAGRTTEWTHTPTHATFPARVHFFRYTRLRNHDAPRMSRLRPRPLRP